MPEAYINRIATAVPPHDVHTKYIEYAEGLLDSQRDRTLFRRMAARAQIDHRYSCLAPNPAAGYLDAGNFYNREEFPGTAARMTLYESEALPLASLALDALIPSDGAPDITHVIVASCTGFYAPGLDLQIIDRFSLGPSIQRVFVGFMGCHAAINALSVARHIVRSQPSATVLVVNLELCTIHLQRCGSLEKILSHLIFGDGCSACLVSSNPSGIHLKSFSSTVLPRSADKITWHIGGSGFGMELSGQVPEIILHHLKKRNTPMFSDHSLDEVALWAIHPGGRSVLDAVETALELEEQDLRYSRAVLRQFGNMSSAAVVFVLAEILKNEREGIGCAMAFGPGITAEAMMFERVS